MSDNKKPSDNRTALQRIEALENSTMSLFHVNDNMARDMMTVREAIKLLHNKVDAIVKASSAGEELTNEVLDRIMIQNNVDELTTKVANLIAQGFLVAETEVSANSFVVGSELNDDGKTVNPRLQFALKALPADTQAKLLGTKVGDTVQVQEGKLKFKVNESYEIREPQAAPAPTADATPAATDATPVSVTPVPPPTTDAATDATAAPATDNVTPPTTEATQAATTAS